MVTRSILLVDTRSAVLRRLSEMLNRGGYDVVLAASFEDAKRALMFHQPWLIISNLRLAAFNGLHLVHLGRLADPDLRAIVIASGNDMLLQGEAEEMGATVMAEPLHSGELLSEVARLIAPAEVFVERRKGERRQIIIAGYTPERRVADRRAAAAAVEAKRPSPRVPLGHGYQ